MAALSYTALQLLTGIATAALRHRIQTSDGVVTLDSSIRVASRVQVGVFNSTTAAFCLASVPMFSLAATTVPIVKLADAPTQVTLALAANSLPQLPASDACNVPTPPWWATGRGSGAPWSAVSPLVAKSAAAAVGTPAPSAVMHLVQWGIGAPDLLSTTGAAPRLDASDWPVGQAADLILDPSMDALLLRVALSSANGTLLNVVGASPPLSIQVITGASPAGSMLPDARAALNPVSVTVTCPAAPSSTASVLLVGESVPATVSTSAATSLRTAALQTAFTSQALPVASVVFLNATSAWSLARTDVAAAGRSTPAAYFGYSFSASTGLSVWHVSAGNLAAPWAPPAVLASLSPIPAGLASLALTTSSADASVIVLDLSPARDVRAAYTLSVPCWPALGASPVTVSCAPGMEGASISYACAQLRLIPVSQWWDPTSGGRWSGEGCSAVVPPANSSRDASSVTFSCSHLTDFSARFRVGSVASAASVAYAPQGEWESAHVAFPPVIVRVACVVVVPLPFRSNLDLYAVLGCGASSYGSFCKLKRGSCISTVAPLQSYSLLRCSCFAGG